MHGLGFSLFKHEGFECLALLIEAIEFPSDRLRLRRFVGDQAARAQGGIANTPARIDARANEKTQMVGRRRPREARHRGESSKAWIAPRLGNDEASGHERAV